MTKPLLFPTNLVIGFEGRMIEAIDNWWHKHSVVPMLSEAIRRVVGTGPVGLVLFLAAGTVVWPVAWFFLAQLFVLFFVGGVWLARHDPALLEERLAPPIQRGQPAADKMLLTVADKPASRTNLGYCGDGRFDLYQSQRQAARWSATAPRTSSG
jgi:hypothetical protein